VAEALSLRPAQIELSQYALQRGRIVQTHPITLRGRFAMRLAQKGKDETGVNRTGLVRTAFNSPFRPFVLASTSVGQEGLDFHPYCHGIVHWNLPGNPVDMEQREGRVHRYKNHAVRLNLVAGYFQDAREGQASDPWASMFDAALHGHIAWAISNPSGCLMAGSRSSDTSCRFRSAERRLGYPG